MGRILAALCTGTAIITMSAALAGTVAPDDVAFDGVTVEPLTDTQGDAVNGKIVLVERKQGNCLACHQVSDAAQFGFHGNVGPPLDGTGSRWDVATLRAIVVNSKAVFGPQTIMPGFYTLDVGVDVREDLVGQPVLTAQQVEDVVAYLATLTEE